MVGTLRGRTLNGALMLGAFTLGTSENVVSGVLPELARSFHVPLGTAGLLVTVYAAVVTIAGPIVTVAVARWGAVRALMTLLTAYLVSVLVGSVSTSFALLTASRVVGGLAHTTLLVLFILTAMRLAPEGMEGRAVGRVAGGLALAAVLGVPVGVLASDIAGWRAAFGFLSVLSALTLLLLLATYPRDMNVVLTPKLTAAFAAVRRRIVLGCVMCSALGAASALTVVTYAVPLLTRLSGLPVSAVAFTLLLYGLGGVVGNALGGRLADRLKSKAVIVTLGILALMQVMLSVVAPLGWAVVPALFAMGASYFATFSPLNAAVARDTADLAPDAALALNSSAFNVGIAAAGVIGGGLMGVAPNASLLAPAGAVLALGGMLVSVVASRVPDEAVKGG